MEFQNLLLQNQTAILKRWFSLILEAYPADAAALMREDQNRFTNPVGSTLSREIESLFKGLVENCEPERFSAPLSGILKIRSVQDFSPSQAVGFVLFLKKAIGETLGNGIIKGSVLDEWLEFQSRIDEVSLRAFDLYMECREKICEITVNRARAEREMAFRMLERMTSSKEKQQKGQD